MVARMVEEGLEMACRTPFTKSSLNISIFPTSSSTNTAGLDSYRQNASLALQGDHVKASPRAFPSYLLRVEALAGQSALLQAIHNLFYEGCFAHT
ncbi:hypothetical protein E2C01_013596 [Portunus trituberculatus]|uniref:Uncharacterized protein n=1 Tax=Portunus trituberculatus TaxID=210409 RepID=A0A5B7DHG7_PORTR|nr:hypothetical protein [Portunus trituberculatus]